MTVPGRREVNKRVSCRTREGGRVFKWKMKFRSDRAPKPGKLKVLAAVARRFPLITVIPVITIIYCATIIAIITDAQAVITSGASIKSVSILRRSFDSDKDSLNGTSFIDYYYYFVCLVKYCAAFSRFVSCR